ncbi:MAG: RMD1 family protein [Myxococcaceae bacterium]|nr:RMD1 family protein [Myxococcaceae bacterium]MBH2006191.1 RMD1 family protein [Myxococcaceae bacterium]
MQVEITETQSSRRCSAYCTANSYQMKELLEHLQEQKALVTYFRSSHVIHHYEGEDKGDVFYFSNGTVVMWGLSIAEEQEILFRLRPFESDPVPEIEIEESRYSIGRVAKILRDDITIPNNDLVTKLAFAHGLAQSVKLEIFEKRMAKRIASMEDIPKDLAVKGRIQLSRKQLTRVMGELILERNSINLYSNVFDTPDFFWEHSELEPLYRMISQDLEVTARINVLNKRMDMLKDLVQVLNQEVNTRYSFLQEWVIILWITFEIVTTILADVLKIL